MCLASQSRVCELLSSAISEGRDFRNPRRE
jgi:hypothetical protein